MNVEEIKKSLSLEPINVDICDINKNHKLRMRIKCGEIYFESFFVPSNVHKLYVCLTALAQNIKEYPVFHRATWAAKLEGAFLCIDDPTREIINHEVSTYFYGKNECNIINYIVDIVKKFSKIYNIENSDVYFVSNSNGGFAAISCCDSLNNSNCIVFNANVNMPLWQKEKSTNNITHDILFQKIFNVNFSDDRYYDRFYLDRIFNNKMSKFYLYYNIASRRDKEQLDWLCDNKNIKYNNGIQRINNIFLHIDEVNSEQPIPHHIFPNEAAFPIIENVIKNGISKISIDSFNLLSKYMKLFYAAQNKFFNVKKELENIYKLKNNDTNYISNTENKDIDNIIIGNKIIIVNEDGSEETVNEYPKIKVCFLGENGLLKIHKPIHIKKNLIVNIGEQCIVEINSHASIQKLTISVKTFMSACILGKKCSVIDAVISIIDEERLKVVIGDDCMISKNVMIRTSDGHAVIDLNSNKVINKAKCGIYIGNHVWLGLNSTILKDVVIPSGCMIGCGSIVTKREYKDNCIIAGIPAKIIKENIKWDREKPDKYIII